MGAIRPGAATWTGRLTHVTDAAIADYECAPGSARMLAALKRFLLAQG
jgi:hypothetical protein